MKTVNALSIRAALRVARKDIKVFLKERGTLLYLFVVPIMFIVGFSAVSGVQGEPREKAIVLPVVNLDARSEAAASPDQQAFTAEIIVEQAQSQFERSRTEPLLGVEESWPQRLLERDEDSVNPLTVNVPGFLVLFVFLTAQTTAQAIYEEKEVGSFRRLLAAPISKATILVGKMTPNFVTGLAQVMVLLCAGALLSPALGLGRLVLGNDPLALILVCLVILLCSTSLGVLIAATARTRDQISGLSQVALWTFGFAGIMLDRIPLPSPFDMVSRLIPHYWANMAFQDLFVRGQDLADITSSLLALLGFTVAFFAVGLWRFRFN